MSHDPRSLIFRFGLAFALGAVILSAPMIGCKRNRVKQAKVLPERTEVTMAFSPAWYNAAPYDEEGRLVTTAQGVGANPTISESLAINQARQAMALSIDTRVDVLQRNFQEQVEAANDLRLLQRFQDVNAVVASHALRGSVVVRKETYVEPNGDDYRTFVMMELDDRFVDAAYHDRLKQMQELETRLRSGEAWAELERRARELREERARGGVPPMTDREIMGGN